MEFFSAPYVFLALVVIAANTVEAMTGFGATIIAVTLGAQVLPIEQLVPILVPINIVLSGWIVIRHRRHIDQRQLLRRILPLAGAGLPVGYWLFTLAPGRTLELVFGCFVVVFAIREIRKLLGEVNVPPIPLPVWQGRFWLFAGGVAQGLYASGGPMVVYYAAREIPDKARFRATLSSLWLVLSTVLAAGHYAGGQSSPETWVISAMLLVPLIMGIVIGEVLHDRIPQEKFRLVVMALLLLAGAALLLKPDA